MQEKVMKWELQLPEHLKESVNGRVVKIIPEEVGIE
jgi:hypothetical protein